MMIVHGKKKKTVFWVVALLTFSGMVMRLASCFWGYPLALHPDELTIVDSAIDMIRRHSWLSYAYSHPDQFEIKCDAALFAIASRILFKIPAPEAFESHYMAFYVIARGYTAVFGTAMIPLAAILTGRMIPEGRQRQAVQIMTAGLFAFSPVLVEHSAYATPDIVQTFFMLLFALFGQFYLESGKAKDLWPCVIVTAIGITIKYPAAILCIAIAAMVIYRSILDREYRNILRYGILSIIILLTVIFAIAPNLFTDFQAAASTLLAQNGPSHLGADNLGWAGNMLSYLKTAVRELEPLSLVFVAAGIVWSFQCRTRRALVLLLGPLYLVCISALSYHWVQWGIPVYVFYDILVALGISAVIKTCTKLPLPPLIGKTGRVFCIVLAGILGLNLIFSAAGVTREKLIKDTRSVSLDYCVENGITTSNSIYEGYTPLSPNGAAGHRYYVFHMKDGKACVNEPYATKRYFVTSDSYSGRFLAESERYPDQSEIYRAIPESFDLIYQVDGAGGFNRKTWAWQNIPYTIQFFKTPIPYTGNTIYIYDLAPVLIQLETVGEKSFYLGIDEDGVVLSAEPQSLVLYCRDDGAVVILFSEGNLALGAEDDGSLIAVSAEAENECHFELQEDQNGVKLATAQGYLAQRDGVLQLQPCSGQEAQYWKTVPVIEG